MLTALKKPPRDAELLGFEAGCRCEDFLYNLKRRLRAAAARPSSPPSTRGTRLARNPSPTAVRPSPPHHAPAFQVGMVKRGVLDRPRASRPSVSVSASRTILDRPALSTLREHGAGPASVQVVHPAIAIAGHVQRSRRSGARGVLHLDRRRPDAANRRQGQGRSKRKQGNHWTRWSHPAAFGVARGRRAR